MEFQVRTRMGNILLFDTVDELHFYWCNNAEDIVKISFTGNDGENHRFITRESGGLFDISLLKNCRKTFPIGTELFVDVPLVASKESFDLVTEFSTLAGIDYGDAYDFLFVKQAFTTRDFWQYMRNVPIMPATP